MEWLLLGGFVLLFLLTLALVKGCAALERRR